MRKIKRSGYKYEIEYDEITEKKKIKNTRYAYDSIGHIAYL